MLNHRLIAAIAVSGSTLAASAEGVTLHFDADRPNAVEGETIHWIVSASFTGYADPTAYFGLYVGDFVASTLGAATADNFTALLGAQSSVPFSSQGSVHNINISSLALLGTDDPSNPIPIFSFDTTVDSVAAQTAFSFSADGDARVYPDNGILTQGDDYASVPSESDTVTIAPSPIQALVRMSPWPNSHIGFGDTVDWTLTLETDSEEPVEILAIRGIIDQALPTPAPTDATGLLGDAPTVTPIDHDRFAFEATGLGLTSDGELATPVAVFPIDTVFPGSQRLSGEIELDVIVDGRVTTLSTTASSTRTASGPTRTYQSLDIRASEDSLIPGETSPWIIGFEAPDEFRGREVRLSSISGSLEPRVPVQTGPVTSLVGGSTSQSGAPTAVGFELTGLDIPLGFTEPTALLAFDTTAAELGAIVFDGPSTIGLTVDGIPYEHTTTSTSFPLGVLRAHGVAARISYDENAVLLGRDIDATVTLELPDAVGPLREFAGSFNAYDNEGRRAILVKEADSQMQDDGSVPGYSRYNNIPGGTPILDGNSFEMMSLTLGSTRAGSHPFNRSGSFTFGEAGEAVTYPSNTIPLINEPLEILPLDRTWFAPAPEGTPEFGSAAAMIGPGTLLVGEPGDGQSPGAVRAYDVTDRRSPVELSAFSPAGGGDALGTIILADGPLVLLATDGGTSLVDYTDPAAPALLSQLPDAYGRLAIGEGLALIGDRVYDLADPEHPTELATLAGFFGTHHDFAIRDGMVIAASIRAGNAVLWAWDAQTGVLLAESDGISLGPIDCCSFSARVKLVLGEGLMLAVFADTDHLGQEWTSVSALFAPPSDGNIELVGRLVPWTDSHSGTLGNLDGSSAALRDGYALIGTSADPDYGEGKLHVFDISDPSSPEQLAAFPGAMFASDAPFGSGDRFGASIALSDTSVFVGAPGAGAIATYTQRELFACVPADLATPYGVIDLADINAFVAAFTSASPEADFDGNGLFDLADIVSFVDAFNEGCP